MGPTNDLEGLGGKIIIIIPTKENEGRPHDTSLISCKPIYNEFDDILFVTWGFVYRLPKLPAEAG